MTARPTSIGPAGRAGVTTLPGPRTDGTLALERAIESRRSVRDFAAAPLSDAQLGQLCWAAQGITDAGEGLRAAPSAGGIYPMNLYVADAGGVREHLPQAHALRPLRAGDVRAHLQAAALDQSCVGTAPACLVITMTVGRCAGKYGQWAARYCLLEAGHIAQNILLQAVALGLAAVPVGAFETDEVTAILGLPASREPVYLVPVGAPAGG